MTGCTHVNRVGREGSMDFYVIRWRSRDEKLLWAPVDPHIHPILCELPI